MFQKTINKVSLSVSRAYSALVSFSERFAGALKREITFFYKDSIQRLRGPEAYYHSEALPASPAELALILEQVGTAFWLFPKQVYVSFFAEECDEGPLCIHYQMQPRGLIGMFVVRLFLQKSKEKLRQHSRRLLFYLYWNTGKLPLDLAGFEHGSHAGLVMRFGLPFRKVSLAERLWQQKLLAQIRGRLALGCSHPPLFLFSFFFAYRSHSSRNHFSKGCPPLRLRRVLIQSWAVPKNSLRSILPPPFHPAESLPKENIVFYSITALEAGPLGARTGRAKFPRGREKKLVFFIFLPVFCFTDSKRLEAYLPLRHIHFDTHTGKSPSEPLRARWNAYKDFLRFDIGDAKGRLLTRTEFVAEHPLGGGDGLPSFLSRPSFSTLKIDAQSLDLRKNTYRLDFAVNRISVLESLGARQESLQSQAEFLGEQLGLSEIRSETCRLLSYLDFQEEENERKQMDFKEFQYRPKSADISGDFPKGLASTPALRKKASLSLA